MRVLCVKCEWSFIDEKRDFFVFSRSRVTTWRLENFSWKKSYRYAINYFYAPIILRFSTLLKDLFYMGISRNRNFYLKKHLALRKRVDNIECIIENSIEKFMNQIHVLKFRHPSHNWVFAVRDHLNSAAKRSEERDILLKSLPIIYRRIRNIYVFYFINWSYLSWIVYDWSSVAHKCFLRIIKETDW